MPRYEYRHLNPLPAAADAYDRWVARLDEQFANRDINHRSEVVRDALHELYLGEPYAPPAPDEPLATQALVHSFDPRNATLEPEYYGDIDIARYSERKPLIYFWMMYDRSPVGLNHALGYRVRAMAAKHVLKHIGKNVKIFHGVEVSFGYNLTIEDDCVIHKYVLLDDRGEIIIHEGTSISDYANVYSHTHDLNDGMIVTNHRTEIGPKARVTYHATVLSGVRVGEHGLVGSMGVATKDVPDYNIVVGIPAKTVKVKSIAPAG
jgi:acetyltransferase-like isoleucine patch superfamily enzyme